MRRRRPPRSPSCTGPGRTSRRAPCCRARTCRASSAARGNARRGAASRPSATARRGPASPARRTPRSTFRPQRRCAWARSRSRPPRRRAPAAPPARRCPSGPPGSRPAAGVPPAAPPPLLGPARTGRRSPRRSRRAAPVRCTNSSAKCSAGQRRSSAMSPAFGFTTTRAAPSRHWGEPSSLARQASQASGGGASRGSAAGPSISPASIGLMASPASRVRKFCVTWA